MGPIVGCGIRRLVYHLATAGAVQRSRIVRKLWVRGIRHVDVTDPVAVPIVAKTENVCLDLPGLVLKIIKFQCKLTYARLVEHRFVMQPNGYFGLLDLPLGHACCCSATTTAATAT